LGPGNPPVLPGEQRIGESRRRARRASGGGPEEGQAGKPWGQGAITLGVVWGLGGALVGAGVGAMTGGERWEPIARWVPGPEGGAV